MIVRVEPSGCCERKGLVQIRFCFYLNPNDARYDEHHIQVPEGLLKKWQNNPFHNHFIYVEPGTTDDEIMDIGVAFLNEAYIKWASNKKVDLKNKTVKFYDNPSKAKRAAIKAKVKHLKETSLERKPKWL